MSKNNTPQGPRLTTNIKIGDLKIKGSVPKFQNPPPPPSKPQSSK